jgi:hypothetical protein
VWTEPRPAAAVRPAIAASAVAVTVSAQLIGVPCSLPASRMSSCAGPCDVSIFARSRSRAGDKSVSVWRQRSAAAWRGGRRGGHRVRDQMHVRCGVLARGAGDWERLGVRVHSMVLSVEECCGECGRHTVSRCARVQ